MERELWPILYRALLRTAQEVRQKYVQLQPWVVVATMLWAALHDRPVCWACDPDNWSTTKLRPAVIPSEATMSRRADSIATGVFWRALEQRLRASGSPALLAFLDGKPLPIGGDSKDRDARWGRSVGGFAKGYKLHAVWSTGVLPEAWEVTPLNVSEKEVAYRLIGQLHYGGYLLADGEYDASYLYDRAFAQGYQLLAPCRKAKEPGSGKHYQSPHRLHSIELLQEEFGRELFQAREQIERSFGNATSFGGGLTSLPPWVRGLDRVRTWVWAKLLINAARILKHKDLRLP
jgi:Transposase DDE domain